MSLATEIPLWLAVPVAALLVLGAGLALVGAIGLLRLPSFYDRVHAPALAATLGIGSILVASMLFFSVLRSRAVLHEALIAAVVVATMPVTLMLLTRAALYRDQRDGEPGAPPLPPARGMEE